MLNRLMGALFIAFAMLGVWPEASAQQARQFGWLGYCQITSVATATAVTTANCSTGSVPASPAYAEICVSGAAVRYISDASRVPTSIVGIPVSAGTCFQYAGPISRMQFIQQAASATLDIEFFQ